LGSFGTYFTQSYAEDRKVTQRFNRRGRRRAIDNIYIERFWRSIKYERIYLNPPNGGVDLRNHVHEYITFYNEERRHTEIGKVPPDELYFKKKAAS